LNELLVLALRASSGRHAAAAQDVLLTIILLRLLADAAHEGPPHAAHRPPRRGPTPRSHRARRATITGRRARG
jgi:hypothetical protein